MGWLGSRVSGEKSEKILRLCHQGLCSAGFGGEISSQNYTRRRLVGEALGPGFDSRRFHFLNAGEHCTALFSGVLRSGGLQRFASHMTIATEAGIENSKADGARNADTTTPPRRHKPAPTTRSTVC